MRCSSLSAICTTDYQFSATYLCTPLDTYLCKVYNARKEEETLEIPAVLDVLSPISRDRVGAEGREANGRFQRGNTLGIGRHEGQPPREECVTGYLRRHVTAEMIVRGLLSLANSAKDESTRLAAWRTMYDRLEGRVREQVDMTVYQMISIEHVVRLLSDAQRPTYALEAREVSALPPGQDEPRSGHSQRAVDLVDALDAEDEPVSVGIG